MSKIKCTSCGWIGDTEDMLSAQSPFKPAETIYACPNCKEIEQVAGFNNPWTDERAALLIKLKSLIMLINGINHTTGFIEHLKYAINMTKDLLNDDLANNRISFIQFLTNECINARLQERKSNEQTKKV